MQERESDKRVGKGDCVSLQPSSWVEDQQYQAEESSRKGCFRFEGHYEIPQNIPHTGSGSRSKNSSFHHVLPSELKSFHHVPFALLQCSKF